MLLDRPNLRTDFDEFAALCATHSCEERQLEYIYAMREKFAERLGGKLCPNRYYDVRRLATIRGKLSRYDKEKFMREMDVKSINNCMIFNREYGVFSHHYPYYLMYIVADPVFESEEHYHATIQAINNHFRKFCIRVSKLSDLIPTTWLPGRTRLLVYERAL